MFLILYIQLYINFNYSGSWFPLRRFPVSRFQILDSRFWIPDSGFQILDSGFQIPDSGFQISDSRFWISDSGFLISISRFLTLGLLPVLLSLAIS